MDNYTYGVNGAIPSRYHTCVDFSTISEFLLSVLNGTITDFALSSFFQQNSDYITNVNFFPIDVSKFIDSSITQNVVVIGSKLAQTSHSVKQIVQWKNYVELFTITINRIFNNFLDFAPYTRVKIYIPYFEFVEIPLEYAYIGTLTGYVAVDFSSGKATLYIMRGSIVITTKTAQLSISVPIGKTNAEEQNRNKVLHTIQASISGGIIGLGVGSGNPLITGAGVSKVGNIIINALNDNLIRLTSYTGGDGNTSSLAVDKNPRIIYEYPQEIQYPNASLVGKPCKKTLVLSTLTGFTKVGNINFDPKANDIYQDEISEITQLLQSGVII